MLPSAGLQHSHCHCPLPDRRRCPLALPAPVAVTRSGATRQEQHQQVASQKNPLCAAQSPVPGQRNLPQARRASDACFSRRRQPPPPPPLLLLPGSVAASGADPPMIQKNPCHQLSRWHRRGRGRQALRNHPRLRAAARRRPRCDSTYARMLLVQRIS